MDAFFVIRFSLRLPPEYDRIRVTKTQKKERNAMMYIHYCKYCKRIHILNGHKVYCPACSGKLQELSISYLKYVNMSKSDRTSLKERCADSEALKSLSADYRLHRYSKWFKQLELTAATDKTPASLPEYTPHPGACAL